MNSRTADHKMGNPPNQVARELEFQVSSVLSRLEEAVEKFDSKATVTELEVEQTLHVIPKSPQEIINIIQDAIVDLNVSKDASEEPNLAILPVLREVDRLALVSHSIKHYILSLNFTHSDYIINWIEAETSKWIAHMFSFVDYHVFYDDNYLDGFVKLYRFLITKTYPLFNQDGFQAFKQSCPVIFYDTPAMFVAAQYICCRLGLPLQLTQQVPLTTSDPTKYEEFFQTIVIDNKNNNRIPLLFLASAETDTQQSGKCSLSKLKLLCGEHNIWLHLSGSSIVVLPLLQRRGGGGGGVSDDDHVSYMVDSLSVVFGTWLNILGLPTATILRINSSQNELIRDVEIDKKRAAALPLWSALKCFGLERILNDFTQRLDSCRKMYRKLEQYQCLMILSQPPGGSNPNLSTADFITKLNISDDVFDQAISSVVFKFLPENHKLWSASYCDKLNSWLSQVVHRELPVFPINVVELDNHGLALRFSPLINSTMITEAEWTAFYASLDQQLDILKATVAQKEVLYNLMQNSTCMKLVELPDWAGLGGVRFVPEKWNLEEPRTMTELNRLNYQIVQQLRNTDSAFSIGESADGWSCIRFGMIGSDSDVTDLINLVESVGRQEEEAWNYLDTMTEVVKKGIETAMQALQQESEEKLWQDGILRHVPVFGSFVNWWSPLNKENPAAGIKGRSLDLNAGVIESTENIYRYHDMQKAAPNAGSKTPKPTLHQPDPRVSVPKILPVNENETQASEVVNGVM